MDYDVDFTDKSYNFNNSGYFWVNYYMEAPLGNSLYEYLDNHRDKDKVKLLLIDSLIQSS